MKTSLNFQALGQSIILVLIMAIFIVSTAAFGQSYCVPANPSPTPFFETMREIGFKSLSGIGSQTNRLFKNFTATNSYSSYVDASNLSINAFTFRKGDAYQMTLITNAEMGIAVWIDFNFDGDFADAGEMVVNYYVPNFNGFQSQPNQMTAKVSFSIPATTPMGFTRMRIRGGSTGINNFLPYPVQAHQSCTDFPLGPINDFSVYIDKYREPIYIYTYSGLEDGLVGLRQVIINGEYINLPYGEDVINPIPFIHPVVNKKYKVTAGRSMDFRVNPFTRPNTYDQRYFGAFIDYNDNGNFSDPGEFVASGFLSTSFRTSDPSFPITIPANTSVLGLRRLRIRTDDSPVLSNNSESALRGNTADLVLEIGIGAGFLSTLGQLVCTGGDPAPITFSALPSGSVVYNWYYQDGLASQPTGVPSAPWILIPTANPVTGATSSTYDPPAGLSTTRSYACYVTSRLLGAPALGWALGVHQVRVSSKYCITAPKREAVEEDKLTTESKLVLDQNFPNPFNGQTTISALITEETQSASIQVFGLDGRKVKEIQIAGGGKKEVEIYRKDLPSAGIYMYSLVVDGQAKAVKRMIVTD